MKSLLLGSAIAMAGVLTACQQESEMNLDENSATVTFRTSGWTMSVEPMTRASLDDESMTDLYVCDGNTVLAHQTSSDEDFGSPTVTLTFGEHNLSFIATRATDNEITDGVFSCSKVLPTFGKLLTLTVNKDTEDQSVEMNRIVSCARYTVEDAVPSNAVYCRMSLQVYYKTFTVSTLLGINKNGMSYSTWKIPNSWIGSTGNTTSLYTFCPSLDEEFTVTTSLEFADAENATISEVENTNVPLLANRITNIHGNMFTAGNSPSVTLNSNWTEQKDVDL